MTKLRAALLCLTVLLATAPAAAQGIPDYIPDDPGESLADREQKRLLERHRGFLGRFFTGGTFAVAPIAGPRYEMDAGLGYTFTSGDALVLSVGARAAPMAPRNPGARSGLDQGAWMVGLGYELGGTRFFGPSPLGLRTALGLGGGAMAGVDFTAAYLKVTPTYAVITRPSWSLPVGLTLSVASIASREPQATLTRAFVGLNVGVRWHLMHRDRLD